MRKGLTTYLTVALCATGLFVAGCGDDDEGTTTSSTTSTTSSTTAATGTTGAEGQPLSEEQYVAQANEICDQGDADLDKEAAEAFSGSGQPSEAEASAFFTDSVIPGIQSQIDEIRSLSGPEEVQSEVTSILDDAQVVLDDLSADPSSFQEINDPFSDVNKRFNALGITSCADNS